MNEQKTIVDIIAEKRRVAERIRNSPSIVPGRQWDQQAEIKSLADEADRLEAAHKREKAAIEADALAVGGMVAATAEKSSAVGDAAAMREALEKATERLIRIVGCDHYTFHRNKHHCDFKTTIGECRNKNICETIFKAQSALAAPPRNCDVLKLREGRPCDMADQVWRAYKQSHMGSYLDVCDLLRCIGWLLSPATEQEGGAK